MICQSVSAFDSEVLTWIDSLSLFLLGGAGGNVTVAVAVAVAIAVTITVAIDIDIDIDIDSPSLAVALWGPQDWPTNWLLCGWLVSW